MVVPKKSSTTGTPAAYQRSVTPSRIPRPDSGKDRNTPPCHTLKPSSATPLIADSPAIFDLHGRRVKNSTTAEQKNTNKESTPESVEATEVVSRKEIVPRKEIVCIPSELTISADQLLRQQVLQDILQRDGEVTIRAIKKLNLDESTTATLMEIPNKASQNFLIGDNSFNESILETSQSQAIFNYRHDEENVPSSTNCEGDCLRRIASRCSFVNICEGECRKKTTKRGFPWVAFFNGIMTLMIVLILTITLLVNYNQLVAIWYGHELREELILPMEESYFEKVANFLLRFWMGVKNLIVLDELDEDP